MADALFTFGIACFVLAGITLVVTIVFFFRGHILGVIAELTGKTANDAIAKIRQDGTSRTHKGKSLQSIIEPERPTGTSFNMGSPLSVPSGYAQTSRSGFVGMPGARVRPSGFVEMPGAQAHAAAVPRVDAVIGSKVPASVQVTATTQRPAQAQVFAPEAATTLLAGEEIRPTPAPPTEMATTILATPERSETGKP